MNVAGAVLDRVPVDQAGPARVGDGAAQPLVVVKGVGEAERGPRHELVEQLAQRQDEAERLVFADDPVGVTDQGERRRPEPDGLERLDHARTRSRTSSATVSSMDLTARLAWQACIFAARRFRSSQALIV